MVDRRPYRSTDNVLNPSLIELSDYAHENETNLERGPNLQKLKPRACLSLYYCHFFLFLHIIINIFYIFIFILYFVLIIILLGSNFILTSYYMYKLYFSSCLSLLQFSFLFLSLSLSLSVSCFLSLSLSPSLLLFLSLSPSLLLSLSLSLSSLSLSFFPLPLSLSLSICSAYGLTHIRSISPNLIWGDFNRNEF